MLKKLLTNSAIYGVAPHVPKILSVFLLPIMTKYLSDVDYGIAGTISAYTTAIAAFSTLGFPVILSISFYRSPCQYKWLWKQIYGFLQLWMILFAFLQGLLLYYIIPPEAEEHRWAIIILSNFSTVFFGPTALIGSTYYQYTMQPIPIAIRSVISGFITVIANFVFVVYWRLGYLGWYIGTFAGTFFVNMSYWYVVNYKLGFKPIFKFKWRTIYTALRTALPTIPHYYSIYLLNSSNKAVMDRYRIPMGVIGELNMAQQFANLMDTVVNAINQAINPMTLNEIKAKREDKAKLLIYTYFTITLTSSFLLSLWSKEIFSLLISNEILSQTYPYAIILIMALNYRPMYIAASNMFFYYEKTLQLLSISFVAGVISFILYIIFIPLYELWAATIVNYIAFLYMGYAGFYMKHFRKSSKEKYPVFRIMSIQIIFTFLAFYGVEYQISIKLLASLIILILISIFYYKCILHRKICVI